VIESDAHESNGPNVSISSKIDLAVTTEIDLSNALPYLCIDTKAFLHVLISCTETNVGEWVKASQESWNEDRKIPFRYPYTDR
jgi:hypothetical protein